MKADYKTELGKSYMILDCVEKEESFAMQMLKENHIQGLLLFEKRSFNGEVQFFYDVTDMNPLAKQMKESPLSEKKLRQLLQELYCVLEEIHSFFLSPEGILLQMEYMYEKGGRLFFCYYPVKEADKWEVSIEMFAEMLLDQIDHEDEEAVELAYQFYAEVKERKKGILYILEDVLTEEKPAFPAEEEPDYKPMDINETYILKEAETIAAKKPDMCTVGCFLLSSLGSVCCLFLSPALHAGASILLALSIAGAVLGWTDVDIKRKK